MPAAAVGVTAAMTEDVGGQHSLPSLDLGNASIVDDDALVPR